VTCLCMGFCGFLYSPFRLSGGRTCVGTMGYQLHCPSPAPLAATHPFASPPQHQHLSSHAQSSNPLVGRTEQQPNWILSPALFEFSRRLRLPGWCLAGPIGMPVVVTKVRGPTNVATVTHSPLTSSSAHGRLFGITRQPKTLPVTREGGLSARFPRAIAPWCTDWESDVAGCCL